MPDPKPSATAPAYEIRTVSQLMYTFREWLNRQYRAAVRKQSCRTCASWNPNPENGDEGECRTRPPGPIQVSHPVRNDKGEVVEIHHDVRAGCPNTNKDFWCSQWSRFRPLFGILGNRH